MRPFASSRARLSPERDHIDGERDTSLVARSQSLQSRVGNALTLGLLAALAVGCLLWYYVHSAGRTVHPRNVVNSAARASNDMSLPPLGPIQEPTLPAAANSSSTGTSDAAALPTADSARPLLPSMPDPAPTAVSSPPPQGGRPSVLDRRLGGAVFAGAPSFSAAVAAPVAASATHPGASGSLAELLQSTEPQIVRARVQGGQQMLLPKGAFIDCTLETAIDSTFPGLTTCVTATDTFSADGSVVLLDRGTKLVGETRGQVQQGQARVFVLWSEARTPSGVVVPLDSPGADELGRAGLPGEVERHFWERFGAAVLISSIDAGVQSAVQSASRNAGTVVYNPGSAQDVGTEVLKSTLSIAPTVVKHNGDRVQVLVARDLDFSQVYALRAPSAP